MTTFFIVVGGLGVGLLLLGLLLDDVLDAVGELANMIAGQAKAELEEFDLSVSLPNVVTGKDHVVRFPSKSAPICVPYDTDLGPLLLEVGLEPTCALASV